MKEQLLKYIRNAIPVGLAALAFLLPLFFGPWSSEPFDFNKAVLLVGAAGVLLILWLLRLTLEGRLRFRKTALDIPLFILLLTLIAAAFFSTNRLLSFTRLEFWTWVSAIILYFVYTNNRDADFNTDTAVLRALKMAGAFLAVIAFAKLLGLDLPNYNFDNPKDFTPMGNILALDIFLLTLLIFELAGVKRFFTEADSGDRLPESALRAHSDSGSLSNSAEVDPSRRINLNEGSTFKGIYSFFYLVLLILTVVTVNPLTEKVTPPAGGQGLTTSWQIASEIVKERPLLGAGPGMYAETFALNKPFSFNNTPDWNTVFPTAASTVFHLLTVTGLTGLLALLLLFLVVFVLAARKIKEGEEILPLAAVFLTLSSLVAFFNPALLFLLFLVLSLNNPSSEDAYLTIFENPRNLELEGLTLKGLDPNINIRHLLPNIFTLPLIITLFIGLLGLQRLAAAEISFKSATRLLESAAPLIPTYNAHAQAAALNPDEPRYRIAFSAISLASAQTIIENATAKKERLTQSDQDFIRNLITQARREADAAVNLNPQSFTTYENRANFYKRITNLAPDAYDLAVADYKMAILQNPNSPVLRARLGVIQRDVRKDYEAAKATLLEAVSLKPDYPEARLELARTHAFLDKKEAAVSEYAAAEKAAADRKDLAAQIRKEREDFEARGLLAIKEILYTPAEIERDQAANIVKSVEDIKPARPGQEERANVNLNEASPAATHLEASPSAAPLSGASPSPTPSPTSSATLTPGLGASPTTTPTLTPTPTPSLTPTPPAGGSTPTATPTTTVTTTPTVTPTP